MGNTLCRQKNIEAAISIFEHARKLDPDLPGAYNGLANAQRQQGNREAALEYFRRSVELNPQQYHPHIAELPPYKYTIYSPKACVAMTIAVFSFYDLHGHKKDILTRIWRSRYNEIT